MTSSRHDRGDPARSLESDLAILAAETHTMSFADSHSRVNPVRWSWSGAASLFVFATVVCLHCGRFGVQSVDQSGVFDGGWRIANGQVPFREFVTLTGVTPMVIQGMVFRILGTTWFAYVLHAALANGLFCIGIAWLLQRFAVRPLWAAIAAALTAFCYYSPVGTPYMEQHGFLFFLAATLCLEMASVAKTRAGRSVALALVPAAVVGMFFSKQNVALMFGPVLAWHWLCLARTTDRVGEFLMIPLAGGVGILVGLAAWGAAVGVDPRWFWEYTFGLAARLGVERSESVLSRFLYLVMASALPSGPILVLAAWYGDLTARAGRRIAAGALGAGLLAWGVGLLLWMVALHRFHGDRGIPWTSVRFLAAWVPAALAGPVGIWIGRILPRSPRRELAVGSAFAAAVSAASIGFAFQTNNQVLNAFPFALAVPWLLLARFSQPSTAENDVPRRWPIIVLLGCVCVDGTIYLVSDHFRIVNDMTVDHSRARPLAIPGMEFLRYATPESGGGAAYDGASVVRLAERIRASGEPFVVFADATFLYGALGQLSPSPEVWFHSTMLTEHYRTVLRPGIEARWIENMRRMNVQWAIVGADSTWMKLQLDDFPDIAEWIRVRTVSEERFGDLLLLELSQSPR